MEPRSGVFSRAACLLYLILSLSHSSFLDNSMAVRVWRACVQSCSGAASRGRRAEYERNTHTQPEQTERGWNCIKTDTAETRSLKALRFWTGALILEEIGAVPLHVNGICCNGPEWATAARLSCSERLYSDSYLTSKVACFAGRTTLFNLTGPLAKGRCACAEVTSRQIASETNYHSLGGSERLSSPRAAATSSFSDIHAHPLLHLPLWAAQPMRSCCTVVLLLET